MHCSAWAKRLGPYHKMLRFVDVKAACYRYKVTGHCDFQTQSVGGRRSRQVCSNAKTVSKSDL